MSRVLVVLTLLAALLVPALPAVAQPAAGSEWPVTFASPQHDSRGDATGPTQLGVRWSATPLEISTVGSRVVDLVDDGAGHLLAAANEPDPDGDEGDERNVVAAISKADGAVAWTVPESNPSCAFAVDGGGRVLVARDTGSTGMTDGRELVAVDAADGSVTETATVRFNSWDCPTDLLPLDDGRLLIVHEVDFDDALDDGRYLTMFAADGSIDFQQRVDDDVLTDPSNYAWLTPDQTTAYVVLDEGLNSESVAVRAFDLADGSMRDELVLPGVEFAEGFRGTENDAPAALVTPDGAFVLGTTNGESSMFSGFLVRVNLAGDALSLAWQTATDEEGQSGARDYTDALALGGAGADTIVAGTVGTRAQLYGFDVATGALEWEADLTDGTGPALVTDEAGTLYTSITTNLRDDDAEVVTLDADDGGSEIGSLPAGATDPDRPGAKILGPVEDGVIYGYGVKTVDDVGRFTFFALEEGEATGSPAIYEPGVGRGADGVEARPVPLASSICELVAPEADSARAVLVARDDEFADALAGAPLAGDDACIVFTSGGPDRTLDQTTRTQIDRALAEGGQIYLLGGRNAVSQAVETELAGAGYKVDRFAGTTRFETAEAIARQVLGAQRGGRMLLAFAFNFADAVTGGAYGAEAGVPVLLSNTNVEGPGSPTAGGLHPATQRIVDEFGIVGTDLLGGTAVLDAGIEGAAPGARRVAGVNRMGTAVEVARQLWQPALGRDLDAFTITNLGNYGPAQEYQAWTVALASAPLAAAYDAPQLGVYIDDYPTETSEFLSSLGFSELPSVTLIGGVQVIQDGVEDAIRADIGAAG